MKVTASAGGKTAWPCMRAPRLSWPTISAAGTRADMPEDIAERLAAITVDVETVEVTDLADELDSARTRPLPAVDARQIASGEFVYTSDIELPGNALKHRGDQNRQPRYSDGRAVIEIRSESSSPMGDINDRFVLDGTQPAPIRRETQQEPGNHQRRFRQPRSNPARSTMGSNEIPVSIELEAPVFGADTALEAALAGNAAAGRLPHAGAFRRGRHAAASPLLPDERSADRKRSRFLPAVFETWKIDLEALDDEGWRSELTGSPDRLRIMRSASKGKLPAQMGGGNFTTVLTSKGE